MALCIGIIGGSGLMHGDSSSLLVPSLDKKTVFTDCGSVVVYTGTVPGVTQPTRLVFVQRHQADPAAKYVQPAKINYPAIAAALASEGCDAVVGVASVGALQADTPLGELSVPEDFYCPWDIRSGFDDYTSHTVPEYDADVRATVLSALTVAGMDVKDGGVYVNSRGPRFETKAEIRFMASTGTIVGMTGAHEATACIERRLPYACLAIVDNMANGVVATDELSLSSFKAQQKENQAKIIKATRLVLRQAAAKLAKVLASRSTANAGAGAGAGVGAGAGADSRVAVDSIVSARWVVRVEPEGVLENHAVVVKDGAIVEVMPTDEAMKKYRSASTTNLPMHALMPGLVNAHAHSPMVYLRGLADDLPLLKWLTEAVWPTEGKFVSPTFVSEGSLHAAAEMIRGGTTTVNDMYFFPQPIAETLAGAGMRVAEGMMIIEFPTAYASDPDDYLAKGRAMYDEITARQAAGDPVAQRISFTMSAHAPYTVSDESFLKVKAMSEELDVPVHVHLHETADECHASEHGIDGMSRHKSELKCRPFKNLDRLGLVNDKLIAVHMTQLNDEEIATLAAKGGHVVHCPTSNLKLASGFCRVGDLVKAGVNVALGTDGACSNNSLDMVAEMKLAAILAKGVTGDATSVPARHALKMATINGARALGMADKIGSLETGKQADMIALSMDGLAARPLFDVESHLVYTSTADTVTDVWVGGQQLLKSGTLTTIDIREVEAKCQEWGAKIAAHKAATMAAEGAE